jgi:hypothetical protein
MLQFTEQIKILVTNFPREMISEKKLVHSFMSEKPQNA